MDLGISFVENAVKAAKGLGMENIPWIWIKYMESGWEIHYDSCHCGNWVWLKPRPHNTMEWVGCVCHTQLELFKLMDTKAHSSMMMQNILCTLGPMLEDVGKIFFTYIGTETGAIMNREEFSQLDPGEVGWWMEISEFNI